MLVMSIDVGRRARILARLRALTDDEGTYRCMVNKFEYGCAYVDAAESRFAALGYADAVAADVPWFIHLLD